mmetsp:Transcript_30828/g.54091  ORF Transcript_30828/g.54091 Transcript_30828/m.54091 type:complete len:189 (+) Transcript_30828:50-616(+)|eukprot:CAMPEP_0197524864 /NCGR_PEP_ID=MMETSP1318-20131121/10194_1 /TAXON_ID=552666 /ORGANISM="Partenskyella glossopodia, Strain RCC365" /LENGTH=188 /DNA_ID=CAMNT_0043077939 /DNA_START=50 /DNA_END=619 /DNA_ORIENTATION=-
MKTLLVSREIAIPEGMKVTVKSGVVTVEAERGTLTKNFKHAKMEITTDGKKVYLKKWMSTRKGAAVVRTIGSQIQNMFTGLKIGYQYKMRLVYNHFPIQASIEDDGKRIEIRNFVGQKMTKICNLPEGVTCRRGTEVKDELVFEGNDIESVSQSAAQVHHLALVRNKDIRKFLDGIYTSEKGHILDEE